MKVIFYTVNTPTTKWQALQKTVKDHIAKKEKLLIIAPDEKALTFLDNIFWNEPKESFLPHCTYAPAPFYDLLCICLSEPPSHDYPFIFNLSLDPYKPHPTAKVVYELEDCTEPSKRALFQKKFTHYQSLGYPISSGSTEL